MTVGAAPHASAYAASRAKVTNESMAYRWAFTCTWPPSFSYLIASPGGLAMIHILRPLSRPVFADGGRLSGHSHRPHRSIYLLPRVPRSPTASLDPRNTFTLRVLGSSVFSLALLSQSLPSRVSPFYTRRSALRLARCSKVPVIGSLLGSRLDSPSRHYMPRLKVCFLTVLLCL